jgi:transcriptional regulator with XRE-family HTH domain
VARRPASSKGVRPPQGARLLALRNAAGLTQIELAKLLDVPQANIAFWEWSEKPPRGEVLPKMAKIFGVRVDDLLVAAERKPARRSGPVGKLQRVFEQASSLPRTKQELVVQFVATLVEQHKKAS